MKLDDLKIATQLRLALGVILCLVVGFGVVVWRQAHDLWAQTQMMYDHPFQVVTEVGEIEAAVLAIQGATQAMLLNPTDPAITVALQEIEVASADASRRLDLLLGLYLGPRSDITDLRVAFAKLKVCREDAVRLLRAGQPAAAKERVLQGAHRQQMGVVIRQIQQVEDLVRAQAARFYQDATVQNAVLNRHLIVCVGVILLLSLVIGGLLQKWIKRPLQELTAVSAQFRRGHLDVRSHYVAGNEFGTLATSFNTMAAEIQAQTQANENAAQLAELMLRHDEVHAFCNELLQGLMLHTGSQVGAVYFQNEAKTSFGHFASIGLGAGGRAAFSSSELEGELGVALATRQIQLITDIPADTRFTFAAVSGDFTPREILTIPVLAENSVVALISLASVHAYDAAALRLVDEIWSVLTARVNGVLAFRKIHYFAEQLEQQNHEMEAQQRELAVQANELTEQNTELEMQKQQLHEANRLKSAFLSNMSHELRTPLNSVIALSGVLHRRLASTIPAEEYSYLEVIERNGRNLLSLINDILDLSRIEAGREDIHLTRFSIRECIDEIVAMIAPQAREKNVMLTSVVADDLAPLTSDPDKCRHILQNLVGNAVKFTEAGTVEISAQWLGETLHVAVRDTGIGISGEQIPHIFDEFRQADDSTSRKYGGTGLGLAIARNYAKLLGGSITVESLPGQGSTFTLHLPQSLELPESARLDDLRRGPAGSPGGVVASGQGHNILVVEDSEAAIIQLTEILQTQGYQVQVARNGKQALAIIEHTVPEAMILDLMMPEVDGFQVLKAIRGTERAGQLPVLILTAKHVTREDLSFLKGNAVYQLIQKGDINKDGLLAAVGRMVTPAAVAPVPPPAAPRRRRPVRPGKPLILLVEDNPDNLLTARALLSESYEVITAEDGLNAVTQARLHQPDLILMDVALPVMDGFEALRSIRDHAILSDIPVLALTASAMQGNREEILARGFDAYVSKPIDHATLLQTLREMLG